MDLMDSSSALDIYDISILLGLEESTYLGDDPYTRKKVSSISSGASYNLSTLTLSAHSGTHIDVPAHFFEYGRTIDQYGVEKFILPAHVIYAEDKDSIKPGSFRDQEINRGDALLFKTANSMSGLSRSGSFSKDYVYMSEESADLCVKLGAGLVGIDYISVDRFEEDDSPVHHKLLERDILILESIDLKNVPDGDYTLFCMPLKIKGAEASPVRAFLLRQ